MSASSWSALRDDMSISIDDEHSVDRFPIPPATMTHLLDGACSSDSRSSLYPLLPEMMPT